MPTVKALSLTALALLWLVMLFVGAGDIDRDILLALHARDEAWLMPIVRAVTFLGEWWTVIAATAVASAWMLYRGLLREALLLVVTTLSGRLLVILEKYYFARLRPEEHLWKVEVSSMSFPSSHAANSMMVCLGFALLAFRNEKQRRWAVSGALVTTFLIGLSRPMLGVHWPSDVIGGWAFGAFWLLLAIALADKWKVGPGSTSSATIS